MTIEDMAGGNFTISNGGVFGSMMGTPIINLPQTAVLGIHAIKDRAVVIDGKIEIRPVSREGGYLLRRSRMLTIIDDVPCVDL
jgi:pyruvate/2-oxoglutarate dehydrogenase complex dihydrolipoamide acyltransferase (E2) component